MIWQRKYGCNRGQPLTQGNLNKKYIDLVLIKQASHQNELLQMLQSEP